jgi:hypothetical protein
VDSGYRPEGGNGCLMWLAALLVTGAVLMFMSGGDDTTSNSADVEAFSRNQANIASTVHNSYYDCLAAGSCVTYTTQTSTSTETNSTRMEIDGDNNTIRYTDYGRPICPNPNNPNEAGDVAEWCAAIGVPMP